ncbi:hypothetical protein PVK06_011226 [Gossypium arboreum]|uniref:Uncharacterized protein n=1 Tax=Gossypium arboreum TaxID=29729 RepID=A0ABR0Q8R5_GOSAR|nr:hypothetical protein PVK06_011226 [Gossypium arboreum]
MSNMMGKMMKMLKEILEALSLLEEVMHDVPNSNNKGHCKVINHLELDNNSQEEFRTSDQKDELNMIEGVADPIDINIEVAIDEIVDVEVALTTNIKLKPFLIESVNELTHFLAIIEEMSYEEVDEFILGRQ